MSDNTADEVRAELARLVTRYRRLLPLLPPGDQFASDIERLVKHETIEVAVARERERCAGEVRNFQNPRAGIIVARHPEAVLNEILVAIERGP